MDARARSEPNVHPDATHLERALTIVMPCYNDAKSASALLSAIGALHVSDVCVVIVDDGSDPPISLGDGGDLRSLGVRDAQVIRLVRNVGHQRAIAVGLAYAVDAKPAGIIVVMDCDGEDKPSDVVRLIEELGSSPSMAIAVAERARRSEGLQFSLFYWLYRIFFRILTGTQLRFGNFSAMRLSAAKRLVNMSELWFSLSGCILRSRVPILWVPTHRGRRYFGRSHMNFSELVLHGMRALAVLADRVITRMIIVSCALAVLALFASLLAVGLKLADMATPGWLTTVLGSSVILFLGAGLICLMGLFSTITGGAMLTQPPASTYRGFLASDDR
jgi:polyisoprenyl-phosphate glycosyltransferase